MLTLIGSDLFDAEGNRLKTLFCPKGFKSRDLSVEANRLHCQSCERPILEFEKMSESEFVDALRHDQNTCVLIKRMDPRLVIGEE